MADQYLTDEQLHNASRGVISHTWLHPMATELLAARARVAELEAERPRFSQRQFVQAHRDRDEAQSRAAELAERFAELEAQQDRVTDLFETWAAEENEHRLANEFGIAEGLKVAIDGLREAVHGSGVTG